MQLLEDFYRYAKGNGHNRAAGIHIVVNGGFYRPEIMAELIRVDEELLQKIIS